MEFTPRNTEELLRGMELKQKEEEKDKKHTGKLIKKTDIKSAKAIYVIGQRKTCCREEVPESDCARKETVDIDIVKTSGQIAKKMDKKNSKKCKNKKS